MEQQGASYVGKTTDSQLISSTGMTSFTPVVIVGAQAATYPKGAAMKDSATAGLRERYTNGEVVSAEEVSASANGTDLVFDLANSGVDRDTLVGYVDGIETACQLLAGTGTNGVDQILFAVAPAGATAVSADYTVKPVFTGACILAEAVTTTAAGGNVTTNGFIEGNIDLSMVLDSSGVEVDSYFKDALPKVRFE